jgi:hypothetical protein
VASNLAAGAYFFNALNQRMHEAHYFEGFRGFLPLKLSSNQAAKI